MDDFHPSTKYVDLYNREGERAALYTVYNWFELVLVNQCMNIQIVQVSNRLTYKGFYTFKKPFF